MIEKFSPSLGTRRLIQIATLALVFSSACAGDSDVPAIQGGDLTYAGIDVIESAQDVSNDALLDDARDAAESPDVADATVTLDGTGPVDVTADFVGFDDGVETDAVEPIDVLGRDADGFAPDAPDVAPDVQTDATLDFVCVPNCDGRVCGDDGCGDSCGLCPEPGCSAESNGIWTSGVCVDGVCETVKCDDKSSCTYNRCGVDQGGCYYPIALGRCQIDGVCFNDGNASPADPCQGCNVSASQDSWTRREDGVACACGSQCRAGACVFTACDGLECGDDGCGGSCGACPKSQTCIDGACSSPVAWYDETSGLTWQVQPSSDGVLPTNAASYCEELTLYGGGWHLPTIDELRTLIRGCASTEPKGTCNVSEDDCLSSSCPAKSCDGCAELQGPGDGGMYWPSGLQGGCCWYISSSTVKDLYVMPWSVSFDTGEVGYNVGISIIQDFNIRCVR